ncbi:AAA family ATPase [Isobaculum melis]|uniref:Uncharacterized protein n=1 Tax=Isobaculum melis TaxID=142588 RepID=A0A1H9SCM7_9LACT|nr:hypothetical protein [Isobaculum melis]SER82754.1 hypothetical protein SAMN04488559_10732 [Isobaculum melis]
MASFITFISLVGLIFGGGFLVKALIKKQPKKKSFILTGISFVVLVAAVSFLPANPKIDITEKVITTNDEGTATVKGKTNEQSEITVDGEKIDTKDGTFSYQVTLEDEQSKKITFVASIGKQEKTETVEVKPSADFVAFLKKEKQQKEALEEAETALILAESKPTQKNYDEAATLITSLTKEQKDFTKRLAIVKDNVPIYEAVELAETKQTKEALDSATALLDKATLNKEALSKRLATVQQKIADKEKLEKQLAEAREAVEKAEQEPTDVNYNLAIAKIKEIPNGNTDFTNRANAVKQTIDARKEEERKVAEAQEAQRIAAQQAPVEVPQAPENEQRVLVTRTGSKYHNRVCGNGNYYEASISEALARGLTPCSKCY